MAPPPPRLGHLTCSGSCQRMVTPYRVPLMPRDPPSPRAHSLPRGLAVAGCFDLRYLFLVPARWLAAGLFVVENFFVFLPSLSHMSGT